MAQLSSMPSKPRKRSAAQGRRVANRLEYLSLRDENVPVRVAKKLAHQYRGVGRNIRRLTRETGDICDRPKSGHPIRYDAELLDKATALLVEQEEELHNIPSFVAELELQGVLVKPYDPRAFMTAWKERVKEQGHFLNTESTRSLFLICKKDAPTRVRFARDMLELLEDPDAIDRLVFVDETTIEQSPHPKSGMYTVHAHSAAPPARMLHAIHGQLFPVVAWLSTSLGILLGEDPW